jgi:hypothetical protein
MKPKYKTLAELSSAFKSGELDGCFLSIDKGGASLHLSSYMKDGQSDDEFDDAQQDLWGIFDWSYGSPVKELLDLIGIPAEET